MHELSLVAAIVDKATEVASRAGAQRVVVVRLSLGILSCARREALEFCFPLATRDTPLDGAALEITAAPLVVRCAGCGGMSERWAPELVCGHCGSGSVEVVSGQDLVFESMEVC
jgi:hydrogenase nickel incorporation protein HypA/HybF